MTIELKNVGKRYESNWIFRGIDHCFKSNSSCAIQGSNGSGKSTLLQIISGYVTPSEGVIGHQVKSGRNIEKEELFRHLSICSPHVQLFDFQTVSEAVVFHARFKKITKGYTSAEVLRILNLEKAKNRQIKKLSTGMRQRLKLGLTLLSDVPLVLLDEPISGFDRDAIIWYRNLIEEYQENKTVIVCSNAREDEFFFCKDFININDFK